MFKYLDRGSLSTEDKILYRVNDMEELRIATSMLVDKAENGEGRDGRFRQTHDEWKRLLINRG